LYYKHSDKKQLGIQIGGLNFRRGLRVDFRGRKAAKAEGGR